MTISSSFNTAGTPTYTVRFSSAGDYQRVLDFYTKNYHTNVCNRKEELMKALEANGGDIIIEDKNGNIVGSSIAYPLYAANQNGQDPSSTEMPKWIEIGTTRMILNGYDGLFDIMIALQVLRTTLVEPPEQKFAVQVESDRVREKFNALGFKTFVPPADLVAASDGTLTHYTGSCGFEKWAGAGPDALKTMAQRLITAVDRGTLTNAKTGHQIKVDLSGMTFFKTFEPHIRALAAGQPSTATTIAEARQSWLRQSFK